MEERIKIIYSQIGYDIGKSKQAFVTDCINGLYFVLTNAITKKRVYKGELVSWGKKWGKNWFIADFTSLDIAGKYILEIFSDEDMIIKAKGCVNIGKELLWNSLWNPISLSQLDVRAENSYPEGGWRDCGSEL